MTSRASFLRIAASLFVILLLASPSFAQRRRAVRRAIVSGDALVISGDVVDVQTGQPVQRVKVAAAGHTATGDSKGHYSIRVPGPGTYEVVLSRNGYESKSQTVTVAANMTLPLIKLQAKPTTTVRMTSGQTYELDTDTVEFGYVVPFSGYITRDTLEMCVTGGTPFTPAREDLARIVGPTTATNDSSCCPRPTASVTVVLRNGTQTRASFTDACAGYSMETVGIDHLTGSARYLRFSDIAEVVFH